MGKHGTTGQRVITYMCVWANLCILFIFFPGGLSAVEHVPNWNVRLAWKNLYTIGILSYKDSCYLVHFSSNISCVRTQSLTVVASELHNIKISVTKHAVI
jgi:hypothetical protein